MSAHAPPAAGSATRRLYFEPRGALRSGHLQSTLGSLPPAVLGVRQRAAALLAASEPLLLDCGQGVRLQSFYSAGAGTGRLAVLLHGWEASADSSCVLSLGATLYQHGFDVLRLNLRDHGASHHLNREIFHCCRLSEVVGAVQAISQRFAGSHLYMAGFSLGGNFLLRVAAEAELPSSVRAVVAISPVLDPAATLRALEQGASLYRRHLVRRWSRSLRRKQRAWPGVHQFGELLRLADLRHMTAALVRDHTGFASIEEYLQGYAITGRRLANLQVPSGVLLADDDPLVPAEDLHHLAPSANLTVWRSRYGGHCGFMRGWSVPSAADEFVLEQFKACSQADS